MGACAAGGLAKPALLAQSARMPIDPRRIAVAVAGGSAFLHLYSPQAVLPELAGSFGAGAAEASMVITASTLAVAATAPFTGAIADVVGRKRLIVGALLVLIVPTIMVALSQSLAELIFWRFVQGLLFPPIFAVTVAYVGDEWPANEATGVIGLYASASAVGGFLGRFIPGTLSTYIGWRGGLLALTALTALCFLTVLWLLPREKQFVGAGSLGTSLRQMLAHLRNPRLVATFAVGFGVLFNFIATFTYVTFHLAAPPFSRSAAFLG
jgi:predicted MFS family arabinose efflux permease